MIKDAETTPRLDQRTAEGRWENEGGATPDASTSAGAAVRVEVETEAVSGALDTRQDELMTSASSDGTPPSRWLRMMGWRWFALGAILTTAGVTSWVLIKGVSLGAVAVGVAMGVLLVGASPVLAAGLLRGMEERAARRRARAERLDEP